MTPSITEAVEHHRADRLDQAELIYRRILDDTPNHPDVLHLLGVLVHQRGNSTQATKLIERAVSINPNNSTYHYNLGEAYRVAGNLQEARSHCQTALQLQPNSPEAHNNMGMVMQALGQFDEAVQHLQKSVELKPGFFLAHSNLGNALRQAGRQDEAIAAMEKALEINPEFPEAHCNLGQLLLETGERDQALIHCRRAVELRPEFPEAQNNLGNVLREMSQLQEAKNCYARAIHLRPNLAMSYNNMGQAVQEEGQLDEAMSWYEKALAIEPRSARFHTNLASVFLTRDRDEEALERYRLALQIDPTYAEAHNGLGHLLQERGEWEEAMKCFQEAIRLKPNFAAAWVNLGQVQEELGDLADAEASFRAALKQDLNHAGALGCLATMLRSKTPDEDIHRMQELLADENLPESRRAGLHHGLAHVLDSQGKHEEAAEHIKNGNHYRWEGLSRIQQSYRPAEHARFVDQLIAGFAQEFFDRVQDWGTTTDVPVFILGMPRSGTTLLEQVLASHPRIYGAGELRYARDSFESLPDLVGAPMAPVECLRLLDREKVQTLAQKHLERMQRLNQDAERIVDKMPDNYLYLGLIAAMFPKARIIHSRRDLRDVALSCWITNFKSIRWACHLDHIAQRIKDYQRLMEHWRQVLPVEMLEVDYEETVDDLEKVARKIVDFAGMEWDPACLEFYKTKRPIRTASVAQVREPIYSRSRGRWEKYRNALAPLLQQLGFE